MGNNGTFWGWRRENGRVGVRNHVVILPLDDLSNAACEAVANNIKGTLAIPHAYGRLQFGADLEREQFHLLVTEAHGGSHHLAVLQQVAHHVSSGAVQLRCEVLC